MATKTVTENTLKMLVRAGVHIGHRKSRRHPKMLPYIYGVRGNTEIIDVTKTAEALEVATAFLKERAAEGALILFVGTRPSHAEIVRAVAQDVGMPYVKNRWIGGTLTNFGVLAKRLERFRALAEQEKSGELAQRYTKAEHLQFQRQLVRFERELGGIRDLMKLPDVLVVTSVRTNRLAALEARKKGVPVVAIVDTDADPSLVDFPVPGNDDAILSVKYIIDQFADAIRQGKISQAR